MTEPIVWVPSASGKNPAATPAARAAAGAARRMFGIVRVAGRARLEVGELGGDRLARDQRAVPSEARHDRRFRAFKQRGRQFRAGPGGETVHPKEVPSRPQAARTEGAAAQGRGKRSSRAPAARVRRSRRAGSGKSAWIRGSSASTRSQIVWTCAMRSVSPLRSAEGLGNPLSGIYSSPASHDSLGLLTAAALTPAPLAAPQGPPWGRPMKHRRGRSPSEGTPPPARRPR